MFPIKRLKNMYLVWSRERDASVPPTQNCLCTEPKLGSLPERGQLLVTHQLQPFPLPPFSLLKKNRQCEQQLLHTMHTCVSLVFGGTLILQDVLVFYFHLNTHTIRWIEIEIRVNISIYQNCCSLLLLQLHIFEACDGTINSFNLYIKRVQHYFRVIFFMN